MQKPRSVWKSLYPFYIFVLLVSSYCLSSCSNSNIDKIIPTKVVQLISEQGTCSGEQVKAPSGKSYVLTAAHCKGIGKDGVFKAKDDNNGISFLHLIAEDDASDLLLLEGLKDVDGLPVADDVKPGQTIHTYTHGSSLDTYKTSGVVIQEKEASVPMHPVFTQEEIDRCQASKKSVFVPILPTFGQCVMYTPFNFSTAFVAPGSSGGPVVNSGGELVGVVSASGNGYSLFVTLKAIKLFLSKF